MPLDQLDAGLGGEQLQLVAVGGPDQAGDVGVEAAAHDEPVGALALGIGLDDGRWRYRLVAAERHGAGAVLAGGPRRAAAGAALQSLPGPELVGRLEGEPVAGKVDGTQAQLVAAPEPQPGQAAGADTGLDLEPGAGERVVGRALGERVRAGQVGRVGRIAEGPPGSRRREAPPVPLEEALVNAHRGVLLGGGAGLDVRSGDRGVERPLVLHGTEH